MYYAGHTITTVYFLLHNSGKVIQMLMLAWYSRTVGMMQQVEIMMDDEHNPKIMDE